MLIEFFVSFVCGEALRGDAYGNSWRNVLQRVVQHPDEEQHERHVHHELQHRVADDVARFQAEDADERQHPERMNQIGQRFGGVVGLHHPARVHVQRLGGLEHVGRFDQPLAAGRRNEQPEERRVDADHHRIGVLRRDGDEEVRHLRGEARLGHHPHDARVERILNQHAADRRHRRGDRLHERPRPPVQQQADDQEQEDVVVQVEDDATRPLVATSRTRYPKPERADDDREQRAVFEPLAGRLPACRRLRRRADTSTPISAMPRACASAGAE